MIDDILEKKLTEIVYSVVKKGEYPAPIPTIEEQIKEKQDEIKKLRGGTVPRPASKQEYFDLLVQLDREREELVAQNKKIISDNVAARQAVDNEFASDVEYAKRDDTNKWAAIRSIRNKLLIESDWTQSADSPLSVSKKNQWKLYRQTLRDLPQTYAYPSDVRFPTQP